MPVESDPQFDRRLQDAKLEALAEFAAGCGHEINNPLATISGRVQLLLKDETDPERRAALLVIGAQAYRVRDMIGDVMLIGRPPVPQLQRLDIEASISTVCGQFAESLGEKDLTLSQELEAGLCCSADPAQFAVVMSELLRNAIEFSPDAGTITVTAQADDENVEVAVSDDGPGLSNDEREHLFDPFYSARQAGRGLGFGLSKCWRIVTNHGGEIRAVSPPGQGLTIMIHWPVASPRAATPGLE